MLKYHSIVNKFYSPLIPSEAQQNWRPTTMGIPAAEFGIDNHLYDTRATADQLRAAVIHPIACRSRNTRNCYRFTLRSVRLTRAVARKTAARITRRTLEPR